MNGQSLSVLFLMGSPRQNGNTAILTSCIGEQLGQRGHRVERIDLARQQVHPCIGCGGCEKKGECVFKDDMVAVYREIERADRIILAAPIYFYALSAQAKLCIDRCQALWSRKYILKQPCGSGRQRYGYLISVAATRGARVFEGAVLCARYCFDAMNAPHAGELLIPGVDAPGTVRNVSGLERQLDNFIQSLEHPAGNQATEKSEGRQEG